MKRGAGEIGGIPADWGLMRLSWGGELVFLVSVATGGGASTVMSSYVQDRSDVC